MSDPRGGTLPLLVRPQGKAAIMTVEFLSEGDELVDPAGSVAHHDLGATGGQRAGVHLLAGLPGGITSMGQLGKEQGMPEPFSLTGQSPKPATAHLPVQHVEEHGSVKDFSIQHLERLLEAGASGSLSLLGNKVAAQAASAPGRAPCGGTCQGQPAPRRPSCDGLYNGTSAKPLHFKVCATLHYAFKSLCLCLLSYC